MAGEIHCVSGITPEKDGWKIRVRVVRLWKQHAYMNPSEITSLDMLLMDEEGQKIHATVKKHLFTKFESVLQDGGVYDISNFGVTENTTAFKMAKHDYKINFYRMTLVKPYNSHFGGSLYGLEFKQFDDILSDMVDSKLAFDVIGHIVASDGLTILTKDGKTIKRISFEMADLDCVRINCTLWGDLAQELADFIATMSADTHVILVMQLGRVTSWNGNTVITSCYYGTRILINSDAEEVIDLKTRLIRNAFGNRIPALASESVYSVGDAFVTSCEQKHIDEIRDLKTVGKYSVVATVVCVQKDQEWYYLACRKCKKGVESDGVDAGKEVWMCPKCDASGVDVVHRFKLQVRAQDHTGSVSFLLFDEVVKSVVNKTASDLLAKNQKDSADDYYPEELNELVGKRFVFKIQVDGMNINKNCRVYTVIKMSDDEQVLAKLLNKGETGYEAKVDGSGSSTPPKREGKRCSGMVGDDAHVERPKTKSKLSAKTRKM